MKKLLITLSLSAHPTTLTNVSTSMDNGTVFTARLQHCLFEQGLINSGNRSRGMPPHGSAFVEDVIPRHWGP